MNQLVYVSRAFVEFGPFTLTEILDFEKRGILCNADYLRNDGQDDWVHVQTWIADSASKAKAPAVKKAKAPAKKAAAPAKPKAKKAPAKKAAAAKPKAPKKSA